jgi:hypothetical protein
MTSGDDTDNNESIDGQMLALVVVENWIILFCYWLDSWIVLTHFGCSEDNMSFTWKTDDVNQHMEWLMLSKPIKLFEQQGL